MVSVAIEQLAEQSETISNELSAGHTLTLVKGGKRIGEIVPAHPEPNDAQRDAAWDAMLAMMDERMDLGGKPTTYEERHG